MTKPLFVAAWALGERIQRAFPESSVVKTLNTITAELMVNPGKLRGGHDVFMSGNDAGAKAQTERILREWFAWRNVVDIGDITTAGGTETYVLFWLRVWGALESADFNIRIVR
jgi:predicted dinucleotide-binding enzyme